MSSNVIEDMNLTSSILDFQANIVNVTYRKKTTDVDPENNLNHDNALRYIWASSKLDEEVDTEGEVFKWRQLGFESEDPTEEFAEVGVLGLDCLVRRVDILLSTEIVHGKTLTSFWQRPVEEFCQERC